MAPITNQDISAKCSFEEILKKVSRDIQGVTENTVFVALLQEANKN